MRKYILILLLVCHQPVFASDSKPTRTRFQEKTLQVLGGALGGGLCFLCTTFSDDPAWKTICFILEPVWRYLDGPKPDRSLVPLSSMSSWLGYMTAFHMYAGFATPYHRIDYGLQMLLCGPPLVIHFLNTVRTITLKTREWIRDSG